MGKMQLPFHVILFGDEGLEVFTNFFIGDDEIAQLPFYTHEKNLTVGVDMLVKVGDVAVIFVNKFTDGGNNAFVVRTVNQ